MNSSCNGGCNINEPSVKDFIKIPLYLVALNVLGVIYYIYLIILFVWRVVFYRPFCAYEKWKHGN